MWKGKNKAGKDVVLLNPAEKGKKYARELKEGCKRTNAGSLKKNQEGEIIKLGEKERAYRAGYLNSRKDSANCYKAKKSKAKKSKANKK